VIIKVHLHVRSADVDLVTVARLDAMIMRLFLVMLTARKLVGAIIRRSDSSEAVFISFIHLLMPLGVPDHLLLLGKHFGLAHGHRAVEMLTIVHVFAVERPAFQTRAESAEIASVIRAGFRTPRQHTGPLGSQDMRWDLRMEAARASSRAWPWSPGRVARKPW